MNIKHLNTKKEKASFDKSFAHRNKIVSQKHEDLLQERSDDRKAIILVVGLTVLLTLISAL